MRQIRYQQAIKEALQLELAGDPRVFIMGQGLDSPWSFGDSTLGLIDEFGKRRVYDIPISENGITGVAVGAAMHGMRPVIMHPRVDFMYLAMDQIVNHAANWHFMFGGRINVPVVIRGVVNRGNEQAAQHSQSPHAMYAHVPGLKVVVPASPADAKGLMISAIRDEDPVVYLDDRWLYSELDEVPEGSYTVPIGEAAVKRSGTDVTIVAISYMVRESLAAAEVLAEKGISAEVVDLRTLKPLDRECISASVAKTGRLVVADSGWRSFGASAEIAVAAMEGAWGRLKRPPIRVSSPDTPVPASTTLEDVFYPSRDWVVDAVDEAMKPQ
jgi:pyruvate dehydrogenase E1 component beta subunit